MSNLKCINFIIFCTASVVLAEQETRGNIKEQEVGDECRSEKCNSGDSLQHNKHKYQIRGLWLCL